MESPISEDEACARSARLQCIEASVDYFKSRGIGDEGEVMALAKRMWEFVKGESA